MINNLMQDCFKKIAGYFGLQLQEKSKFIKENYFDVDNINITAAISNRLSSLTLMDNDISVIGDSDRAKYLNDFIQYFNRERLNICSEVALGTGDCLIKINTIRNKLAVDIIPNNNFRIIESVGNDIFGVIIKCDEQIIDNSLYERYELHIIQELNLNGQKSNCIVIKQFCFKNQNIIPIDKISGWSDIQENIMIPNSDKLLISRIKCPIVNRMNINSANGVPISFGVEKAIEQVKLSYNRFNQEFEDKETMIFANKTLFRVDKNTGNVMLPRGKNRIIMQTRNIDDSNSIHEFSPNIRDNSLENALQQNLKMVELLIGISEGMISKSNINYANVDEIRKSLQNTYAFITKFRKYIEVAINNLIEAANTICNINELTQIGKYDVKIDWSDSYIENYENRFQQLLSEQKIGAIDKAEVRAWSENESYQLAKKRINEIASNSNNYEDL